MNYSIIRFKKRSPPWTKPVFHLSLCFVFGFLTGFTHPPSSPPTSQSIIQLISYQETPDLNIIRSKIPTPPPPPPPPPPPLPAGNSSTRLLIVITTTRSNDRPLHGALLGRLARTLRLVPPPLLWIVVEPHDGATETAGLLRGTGILYRHLTCGKGNFTDSEAEEHHQRNVALGHVEHHRINGIVHFAGVSNVYDLGFFREIRGIEVFGAWPVAIVSPGGQTEVMVKGPVCNSSQVVGWFKKDMDSGATYKWTSTASSPVVNVWGFAFKSSMLWDPERWGRHTTFPDTSQDSMRFVHEAILEDESKVMAVPSSCSQIMLWHLQIQTGSR